ncbi:Mitochondrial beta-keto-acyl synthase, partial [Ascosphaera aggregata]
WNSTPTHASRPFDKDRAGFVVGEGAAVLVLEDLTHALNRGARIYAEIRGYGCSSDSWHITAPKQNGEGARAAMMKSLRHAGLKPKNIDYINAHATSTPMGDRAENMAIEQVMLGIDGKEKAHEINVSSTKGAVGHLLGGAGALEAVFSVMAIENNIMPPTINLEGATEEFHCNYIANKSQEGNVNAVLTNSFGFGGTNASLCFARYRT